MIVGVNTVVESDIVPAPRHHLPEARLRESRIVGIEASPDGPSGKPASTARRCRRSGPARAEPAEVSAVRLFAKLKRFRRVATRGDKLKATAGLGVRLHRIASDRRQGLISG